jgi:hypothetical protein
MWNDTAPTSTQFTVGTQGRVNTNLKDYIVYLWRSIPGFSKVFTYEGNGASDGPFIYCGFRPRFVMLKNADAVNNWMMIDTTRSTYNPVNDQLYADTTAVFCQMVLK